MKLYQRLTIAYLKLLGDIYYLLQILFDKEIFIADNNNYMIAKNILCYKK